MTSRFLPLAPTEARVLTFDFTQDMATGETLTGSPTAAVSVDFGTDASPQAIVKQVTISGLTVLVAVSGMQNNVDYHITVTCPTSNALKTLTMAGILPVRSA